MLPIQSALEWVVVPSCGAVTSFTGTVRDHAEGRDDVVAVEYEAYAEHVEGRLRDIADAARRKWPDIGRLVVLHRAGRLEVGEASVLIAASTPHRAESFEVTRYCIETVKTAVPIWKKEYWSGGADWGTRSVDVQGVTHEESH